MEKAPGSVGVEVGAPWPGRAALPERSEGQGVAHEIWSPGWEAE